MLNLVLFSIYFFDVITRLQFIMSIILLIYILGKKGKIYISKKGLLMYIFFNIYSIIVLTKNDYSYVKMLQQSITCGVIILSYFNLFKYYSIEKIWGNYLKVGVIFSYLAIFQGIIYYLLKINIFIKPYNIWGIDRSYLLSKNLIQVTSLSGEPGMFAQVLLPVVIFTLEKILKKKKLNLNDIIVLIAYLWTFTAIAFFSIGIYIVLKLIILIKNKQVGSIFKFIIISFIIVGMVLNKIKTEMLERKIMESFNAILNLNRIDYQKLNLSSFALFSNIKAAINSNNYILGNGLGSIKEVYYKYFHLTEHFAYGLNSEDGYSLAVRIFSEFGIIGIMVIGYIIIKNIKNSSKYWKLSTINLSVTIGIISYLIRGGSYFMQGIILFFLFLNVSNLEIMKKERS